MFDEFYLFKIKKTEVKFIYVFSFEINHSNEKKYFGALKQIITNIN